MDFKSNSSGNSVNITINDYTALILFVRGGSLSGAILIISIEDGSATKLQGYGEHTGVSISFSSGMLTVTNLRGNGIACYLMKSLANY